MLPFSPAQQDCKQSRNAPTNHPPETQATTGIHSLPIEILQRIFTIALADEKDLRGIWEFIEGDTPGTTRLEGYRYSDMCPAQCKLSWSESFDTALAIMAVCERWRTALQWPYRRRREELSRQARRAFEVVKRATKWDALQLAELHKQKACMCVFSVTCNIHRVLDVTELGGPLQLREILREIWSLEEEAGSWDIVGIRSEVHRFADDLEWHRRRYNEMVWNNSERWFHGVVPRKDEVLMELRAYYQECFFKALG